MLVKCKDMQKIICLQIYKSASKRIKMQMFMICQDECETKTIRSKRRILYT